MDRVLLSLKKSTHSIHSLWARYGVRQKRRIKEGSWDLGLTDLEGGGDIYSDREEH